MKYLKMLSLAAVAAMAFAFRPLVGTVKRYFVSAPAAEPTTTDTMNKARLIGRNVQKTLREAIPTKQLAVNNSISARQVCLA
jgi:hypothetical protein